ncbi:MAG: Gfo/Idh/MocA family oxidoreductase [Armatimonadetes bacterium]|nr:Gfo/Idh/MocA family oxidoreductase [Armatimonadota bacterium]
MAALKVGFIGSGGMAKAHVGPVKAVGDVEVAAFCDVALSHAEAMAKEHGGQAFSTPKEMFEAVKLDVAYILLPPFAHGDAEFAAIENGVPFFVEKPIGNDLALSREIARKAAEKNLITCAGYMNRYRESINRAREMLQEDPAVLAYGGWIGGSPGPASSEFIGSWWAIKAKSGGQIVEQCTHTFDVVRYLCGEGEEVFAHAAVGFNPRVPGYDIDDASTVNIKLKNGGVVNLMSCCASNAGGGVTLTVHAKQSTFLFSGWEHSVEIRQKDKEPVRIAGEGDIFAVEDKVFLEAVRSGDASGIRSPYSDAVKTLEWTLAANRSIETGQPVKIEG